MMKGGLRRSLSRIEMVCPIDHASLVTGAQAFLVCTKCGRKYPSIGNVARFLGEDDAFYEGAYLNQVHFVPRSESLLRAWPLWLLNNGYVWRVRRQLPAGSVVLEIGCAGGIEYFAKRYRMIGLDISMESLVSAARIYEQCMQGDASVGIPLGESSVDGVTSSFFWEHISAEHKHRILAEVRRVLRPNGRLIFLYDVETANPVVSLMRRTRPELYDAEFIMRDGHVGYITPAENRKIFESEGFRVVEYLGLERSPLQATQVWIKLRKWPRPLSYVGSLLSNIDRNRAMLFPYIGILRSIDETVGRALPDAWSRMSLVVCEKSG